MSIICSGDDENKSYCNSPCDALLYEKKDGSFVCSNPSCGRVYNQDSVKAHKSYLRPSKNPHDTSPGIVALTEYHNYSPQKKKKEVTKYEDDYFNSVKSGRNVTHSEEWLPEG
jgi:hypothetical protein